MADEITPKEEVAVEAPIEPVSEPVQASESQTAQIPVNEPLPTPIELEVEPVFETIQTETKPAETTPEELSPASSESVKKEVNPEIPEIKSEPVSESKTISEPRPEPKQEPKSESEQPKPIQEIIPAVAVISKSKTLARELLVKARNMIQFRKRKKLDKVMTLFLKQSKITNDEIEKFLHVSDATATRYLSQLEKEGKIKQSGKTGKSVFYSKI